MGPPGVSAEDAYRLLASKIPPAGMNVAGLLDYSDKPHRPPPPSFPERLSVDVLDLSGREVLALPSGLTCFELNLSRTPVISLPEDLQVASRLDLSGCERLER